MTNATTLIYELECVADWLLVSRGMPQNAKYVSDGIARIKQLEADLDTARADARVLAEECAEWRDAAGIKCLGGWHMTYQNEHGAECYRRVVRADATDASGALERNLTRSKP